VAIQTLIRGFSSRQVLATPTLLLSAVLVVSCTTDSYDGVAAEYVTPPTNPVVPEPVVIIQEPDPELIWPRLFLTTDDLSEDEIGAIAGDLAISQAEQEFIEAGDSGLSTEDKLLLLNYLRNSDLKADLEFESEVRAALRSELSELILEYATNDMIAVSEEEIRALYDANLDQYFQPERVSIRWILVSTEDEAATVLERLSSEEDFGSVAREMSQHSSRTKEGVVEPFSRGTYSQAVENMAFDLEPGMTGTVTTARGIFIINKIAEIASSHVPYQQVREELEAWLYEERSASARQQFLNQLRSEQLAE